MTTESDNKLRIEELNENPDGTIEQTETYTWYGSDEGLPSSSYDSLGRGQYIYDNTISEFDQHRYDSYGTQVLGSAFIKAGDIRTRSLQETNEYLDKVATDIYKDPNPQIVRRVAVQGPVTYEQQIQIRYLQPPAVPPPGPIIIKEVRPPQPPPPPPLVIYEQPPSPPPPPPLILRERPPTPPPYVPSETIIRNLPAIPAPPRSVVIHRFAPLPEKPRNILIERWLPYGPQPERQKIVQSAPAPKAYAEPRHRIFIYEGIQAQTVRRFEKLGIRRENPTDYVARYGSSLLDSGTLLQRARDAGVFEDLSHSMITSSSYTDIRRSAIDDDASTKITYRRTYKSGDYW